MILTLIAPSGERWSATLSEFRADVISGLDTEQIQEAQAAINLLVSCPLPPAGASILVNRRSGWQAILANPTKK